MLSRVRWVSGLVALLAVFALVAAGCTLPGSGKKQVSRDLPEPSGTVREAEKGAPNIVLVLMDDFSMNLLQAMRNPARMAREGASYENTFVTDTLCCVSRSSLFLSGYPFQTGVYTNAPVPASGEKYGRLGGWEAFDANKSARRAFNVRLQKAGYTTGFIGKYLNGYEYDADKGTIPPVPPGWDDFQVLFGGAYDQWDYASTVTEGGKVKLKLSPDASELRSMSKRQRDKQYAEVDIANRAVKFVKENSKRDKPFFLQVSTYAPHDKAGNQGVFEVNPHFPPMFRDRPRPKKPQGNCGPVACRSLGLKDLPGFGDDRADNRPVTADGKPGKTWLRSSTPRQTKKQALDGLRSRARMVQAVDRTLTRLRRNLPDNTYLVLTSDNGLHLGQYGMGLGKGLPYASDSQVPLIITGPGIKPGKRQQVATLLDLAPTFEKWAGLKRNPAASGNPLQSSLAKADRIDAKYAFIEHTWSETGLDDPDYSTDLATVPSYVAVRSADQLLVRWDNDPAWDKTDYTYEFYDLGAQGWEKTNVYAEPRYAKDVRRLRGKLAEFDRCRGPQGSAPKLDAPVTAKCRTLTR